MLKIIQKKRASYNLISDRSFVDIFKYYRYRSLRKEQNKKIKQHVLSQTFQASNLETVMNSVKVFKSIDLKKLQNTPQDFIFLADNYCLHKFNLLGSGWVSHNNQEGRPSASRDEALRSGLLGENYKAIAWNSDLKTKFKWDVEKFSLDIKLGPKVEADIKNVWELGRFYHLPCLLWAHQLTGKDSYIEEATSQIVDFSLACPVYRGPQWFNAMEVSIRLVNLLFFFEQAQRTYKFSSTFINLFQKLIDEHYQYILAQLEWTLVARSNHYLSNLLGLLLYLHKVERSAIQNHLLHWVEQEVLQEFDVQFLDDGGNFEGSTGYHKLSSEIVFLALQIIKNTTRPDINSYKRFKRENSFNLPHFHKHKISLISLKRKVSLAYQFLNDVECNKEFIQIGDNDSGRILRLSPQIDDEDLKSTTPVCHLLKANSLSIESELFEKKISIENISTSKRVFRVSPDYNVNTQFCNEYSWNSSENLLAGMNYSTYEEFGLYIVKSPQFFLAARCVAQAGQKGVGGHNHNDQLSVCLNIKGEWVVKDPGSYVYTSDPHLRNKYRSTFSHFAPRVIGRELSPLNKGLFVLSQNYLAQCLFFDGLTLLMKHNSYGFDVFRKIVISDYNIVITDHCHEMALEELSVKDGVYINQVQPSSMYGEL